VIGAEVDAVVAIKTPDVAVFEETVWVVSEEEEEGPEGLELHHGHGTSPR
jgi:hypothetical protein